MRTHARTHAREHRQWVHCRPAVRFTFAPYWLPTNVTASTLPPHWCMAGQAASFAQALLTNKPVSKLLNKQPNKHTMFFDVEMRIPRERCGSGKGNFCPFHLIFFALRQLCFSSRFMFCTSVFLKKIKNEQAGRVQKAHLPPPEAADCCRRIRLQLGGVPVQLFLPSVGPRMAFSKEKAGEKQPGPCFLQNCDLRGLFLVQCLPRAFGGGGNRGWHWNQAVSIGATKPYGARVVW